MGAKLGKSKSLPISEKVNGHDTNTSTHLDGTVTLDKRTKKKKEKVSNKKSFDIKVDKYTSTDANAIPITTTTTTTSSTYIKHLALNSGSNNIAYDAQSNKTSYSETPSKDVQELRDACIRRGIISPETNAITLSNSIEQEESIYGTTIVTNNEPIPTEQQEEKIESY